MMELHQDDPITIALVETIRTGNLDALQRLLVEHPRRNGLVAWRAPFLGHADKGLGDLRRQHSQRGEDVGQPHSQ